MHIYDEINVKDGIFITPEVYKTAHELLTSAYEKEPKPAEFAGKLFCDLIKASEIQTEQFIEFIKELIDRDNLLSKAVISATKVIEQLSKDNKNLAESLEFLAKKENHTTH